VTQSDRRVPKGEDKVKMEEGTGDMQCEARNDTTATRNSKRQGAMCP
jgi:hypothetical protein